jgi:catechol 2,3-dioxygenase-like lactoylglutathione lyase family enzyme
MMRSRRNGHRADDGIRQLHRLGHPGGGPGIAATKPFDGNAATVGNGVMVALDGEGRGAGRPDLCHRAWTAAAAMKGRRGPRGDGGFYAAYFRDPDGNKLNAF